MGRRRRQIIRALEGTRDDLFGSTTTSMESLAIFLLSALAKGPIARSSLRPKKTYSENCAAFILLLGPK